MTGVLMTSIVLKTDVTLMDIVSTRMLGQFGFLAQVGPNCHDSIAGMNLSNIVNFRLVHFQCKYSLRVGNQLHTLLVSCRKLCCACKN